MNLGSQQRFFSQLSLLVAAGVPFTRGLELLATEEEAASEVLDQVHAGRSLSVAFGSAFGPLVGALMRVAERTGGLHLVLERLAARAEQMARLRREVVSAAVYPLGVVTVSALMAGVLVFFMVPRLLPFVSGFGVGLPWPTRVLVFLDDWRWPLANLALLPLLLAGLAARLRPELVTGWREALRERVGVLRDLDRAACASDLSLALEGGLGVHEALRLVAGACASRVLGRSLAELARALEQGETLSARLPRHPELGPMLAQALAVGEEAGGVSRLLGCAASTLRQEAEFRLSRLTALIEPVMMAFLGLLVGFVVLACLLPIYQVIALPV